MSDCRFGVSPVNYPDPDPEYEHYLIQLPLSSHTKPVNDNDVISGSYYHYQGKYRTYHSEKEEMLSTYVIRIVR